MKSSLTLEEQYAIAQKYLKKRIKAKDALRKKSASRSFEDKLKDVAKLQRFFGRKPWNI